METSNVAKASVSRDDIVAVVVTFDRKVLLRECLSALLAQDIDTLRVLVVDNGSTDGTREYISDMLSERVVYVNTGENLGGAGGFNFGIKEAMKLGAKYIWLMDDDCIVGKDSLVRLLEYADRIGGEFGFLSSAVRYTDGSVCAMNVQRTSITHSLEDFEKDRRIEIATFVSLLLNRDAVLKCGLPIKEFFIWGDDWEYTSRISKEFKNYFVPSSVVTHKCATNIGSDIARDGDDRLGRYFYAYRNERYLWDRRGLKGKLYFLLKVAYHRMKILCFAPSNKKGRLAIIRKGLKASKAFKPEIEFVE